MEELFNKPSAQSNTRSVKDCWFCDFWNNPAASKSIHFVVVNENLPKCDKCGNQLEES